MSRYIDAEWIRNVYADFKDYEGRDDWTTPISNVLAVIDDAPSIDIVRCKECRHWIGETEHHEDREYKACWQLCGQYMNSEFWCKYGEREGE